MSIILLGSEGSMGRRYQAILRYLGISYLGFDIADGNPWNAMSQSDGIIIATPTDNHASWFAQFSGTQLSGHRMIPILCEKPLSTDLTVVDRMLAIDNPLQMMAQYRYCDWKTCEGETSYDYYASGSDGLAWDCVTLLGLARGLVSLNNTSPIWRCTLNGRNLTLGEVQESYIWALEDWLKHPEGDRSWIKLAHYRAATWDAGTPALTICSQSLGADVPRTPGASPEAPADHEGH